MFRSLRLTRKEAEIMTKRLEDTGAVRVEVVERKRSKLYLYHAISASAAPPTPTHAPSTASPAAAFDSSASASVSASVSALSSGPMLRLPIPPDMCCLRGGLRVAVAGAEGSSAENRVDRVSEIGCRRTGRSPSGGLKATAPREVPSGAQTDTTCVVDGAEKASDTDFELRQIIRAHKRKTPLY